MSEVQSSNTDEPKVVIPVDAANDTVVSLLQFLKALLLNVLTFSGIFIVVNEALIQFSNADSPTEVTDEVAVKVTPVSPTIFKCII